jgi:hypothetical protein
MKPTKPLADDLMAGQPEHVRALWEESKRHKREKDRRDFQKRQPK